MNKNIFVYLDHGNNLQEHIGILRQDISRGKEIFSFTGELAWLEHSVYAILDPDLKQFQGPQYLKTDKRNFGLFLDSSPDRWGRMLIKRRELIRAKNEKRNPSVLSETDYLLGVYDNNRMGALRFKTNPEGAFLDDDSKQAAPPWASIRNLEYASLQIEKDGCENLIEYEKWLELLVKPGSSLGGARPKAVITDTNGELWMAKFPGNSDERDIGAWEKVLNDIAINAGINVPETKLQKFDAKGHTFLSKRFDRINKDKRIHFASAMTLLGEKDGADFSTGVSYLDIAMIIIRYGINADKNLEELWRRIVFNVAVSNCDDHLRNHGFLLGDGCWELSPAYDMNPEPYGTGLKLNISQNDNSLDFDLAMSIISYFRLSASKAEKILKDVKSTVSCWREIASKYDISQREQEMTKGAFRY